MMKRKSTKNSSAETRIPSKLRYAIKKLDSSPFGCATTPLNGGCSQEADRILRVKVRDNDVPSFLFTVELDRPFSYDPKGFFK